MARTEQEIFAEAMSRNTMYDNSFVPDIHHTVYNKDGVDVSGLEIEFTDTNGDPSFVILSLDIIEEFGEELLSYKKGIVEAATLGGLEDV